MLLEALVLKVRDESFIEDRVVGAINKKDGVRFLNLILEYREERVLH